MNLHQFRKILVSTLLLPLVLLLLLALVLAWQIQRTLRELRHENVLDETHQMLDDNDRHSGLRQRLDTFCNPVELRRVEPGGKFIEQQ